MRRVFADATYWIAAANRKDQWYGKVISVMRSLGQTTIVTREEVFDEFLTHYSGRGPALRNIASRTVEKALLNPLGVRSVKYTYKAAFLLAMIVTAEPVAPSGYHAVPRSRIDVRYYISGLRPDVQRFARAVRGHSVWRIAVTGASI
jgi:hypothetical protein